MYARAQASLWRRRWRELIFAAHVDGTSYGTARSTGSLVLKNGVVAKPAAVLTRILMSTMVRQRQRQAA
jgi:hypothetical protein